MTYINQEFSDKMQIWITHFLRFTLLVAVGFAIFEKSWLNAFISLTILLLTYVPTFFEEKTKIQLPNELEFVAIVFIYASLFLGEVRGYYTRFWWWDVVLHGTSAIAIGFIGFLIMYILYTRHSVVMSPFLVALFSFCFAVAIGAVWEIFEFGMDQIFGLNMQKSGLVDTMWDLIVDSIGALIIAVAGYFYLKGRRFSLLHKMTTQFLKDNKIK
jgi:uncharacterized membrane protein YjdF